MSKINFLSLRVFPEFTKNWISRFLFQLQSSNFACNSIYVRCNYISKMGFLSARLGVDVYPNLVIFWRKILIFLNVDTCYLICPWFNFRGPTSKIGESVKLDQSAELALSQLRVTLPYSESAKLAQSQLRVSWASLELAESQLSLLSQSSLLRDS